MLRVNLWIEAELVNSSVRTIRDIVFEEGQDPPSLSIAILIEFDDYTRPAIISAEGNKLVLIIPAKHTWIRKKETFCSWLQVSICLVWVITVHKSQDLILWKVIIDFGKREYAADLSFVAISQVCSFKNTLFKPFLFERFGCVKAYKRLQERLAEER